MKQDIHPEYRDVVFQDISSNFAILTRSTVPTRETIKWEDGNEYPLLKLEISSESHPFYTGKQHILQTAKQVDKFRRRYGQKDWTESSKKGASLHLFFAQNIPGTRVILGKPVFVSLEEQNLALIHIKPAKILLNCLLEWPIVVATPWNGR